jgi:hypothetical protein
MMTKRTKSIMSLSFLAIVLAVVLHLQMSARANVDGVEKNQGAVVVELFTSEGCSSCPPADALLRQINGKQTKDGRRIIGISEHVTYWNHLGWSDPFSNDVYTQRQDEYGRRFQLDSVYTPQMVIDGEDQLVGSDRDGLQRELDKSRKPQPITVQINAAVPRGDMLSVSYSLSGSLSSGGAELVAVIADDEARSDVSRGENSGRILTHVSVARSMKRVAATSSHQEQALEISIPRSFVTSFKQDRHLILFVQAKGQGRVYCADEKSF